MDVLKNWETLLNCTSISLILVRLLTSLFTIVIKLSRHMILAIFHKILESFWCSCLSIQRCEFCQILLELLVFNNSNSRWFLFRSFSNIMNVTKKQISSIENIWICFSNTLTPAQRNCRMFLWTTRPNCRSDSFEPLHEKEIFRCNFQYSPLSLIQVADNLASTPVRISSSSGIWILRSGESFWCPRTIHFDTCIDLSRGKLPLFWRVPFWSCHGTDRTILTHHLW